MTGDAERHVVTGEDSMVDDNVSSTQSGFLRSLSSNESRDHQFVSEKIIQMQNMSPIQMQAGATGALAEANGSKQFHQSGTSQSSHPSVPDRIESITITRRLTQGPKVGSIRDQVMQSAETDKREKSQSEEAKTSSPIAGDAGWFHPSKVRVLCLGLTLAILMTVVCHMMPGAQPNNVRLPPRWEPGLEDSLPFRTWLQDLLLWTITSDLEPHRQAALIISQLGGAARELARTLTPQEIFQGGMINGQQLDPVSFLIHGLSTRFSPLDDEIRIRAAQDLLHFQRKGNEAVDVLITRFETIRARARTEGGGANISTESAALILLRAIGVSAEQFQRLTQPFGLRLPNTEAEFAQLSHNLRRMGHIIEHHPANIARSLHGASAHQSQSFASFQEPMHPPSQASSWSFVGYPGEQEGWGSQEAASSSQNAHPSTSYPADWAYYQDPTAEGASDTDSATESDDGAEPVASEDLQGLTAPEADEHLFWQYAEAKRRWRRFTGKPVRSLRRVLRRKGKGKGKVQNAFFDISGALMQSSYFKGKGKGGKSSGKGFGRRQNPKGRDGQILKCSICSSIYHLRKRCPQNPEAQRGRVQQSGPQSSQLPYPPRSTMPSVAGFATENEVTNDDGQVGPASLHFATSTHESFEEPGNISTPRPRTTVEEHALTPDDPWMQWHQDPWNGSRTPHVPQQLPGVGVGVPGVWPPNITGGFPNSTVPSQFQTMHQRPEVGPSLLPTSEMQAMTTMFSTLPQFQGEEANETADRPRSNPFVEAFVHDAFVPPPFHQQQYAPPPVVFMPSPIQQDMFMPPESYGRTENTVPANSMLSGMFSQVHQLRQVRGEQRSAAAAASSSANEVGTAPQPAEPPVNYQGNDNACSICQHEFGHHEQVVRLPCRHVFHLQCYDEYVSRTSSDPTCPNCRGSGEVIARWAYVTETVGNQEQDVHAQPEAENEVQTPPATSRSGTTFHTPATDHDDVNVHFPWWPVPSALPATSFHTSTHRTQSGQLGLLVDPGSYGNLVGEQWAHEAVRSANQAGLRPRIQDKESPLEVGGVGKGTQKCFKELLIPTALRSSDGSVNGGTYTAPMIPKSACPALLGLKSLMSHRAVLDLSSKRLILMPEGSEIEVPPQAEVLPLEQAETGHLLLPIDEYNRMIKAKDEGRTQKQRHMFADAPVRLATNVDNNAWSSRQGPTGKARAAAFGPVTSYPGSSGDSRPTTSPSAQDRWEVTEEKLIRIHEEPRTELFTPKPGDCPRPLQMLTNQRSTHMQFADGAQQLFQDDWLKAKASFAPSEAWTGQRVFTLKSEGSSVEPPTPASRWEVVSDQ